MTRSLFFLDVLIKDEERCINKLIQLALKEEFLLKTRQPYGVLSLIESQRTLINRSKHIEFERKRIHISLSNIFECPRSSFQKLQISQTEALYKRLKQTYKRLLRINQKNSFLIKKMEREVILVQGLQYQHKQVERLHFSLLEDTPVSQQKVKQV